MPARPYWHGHIRLSLVSLPVRLYLAIESKAEMTLHNIYKPTGERIHYQNIVESVGPVSKEDIVKGYEHEKGHYVLLEPEEIEAVKIPSRKIFDIAQFVSASEIDPVYFERPYYVVPDGVIAEEAYIVIRESLKATAKLGIGQIVLGGKEHIAALRTYDKGMVMETLHYAKEIRPASEYFGSIRDIQISEDERAMATELITRKSAPFDPASYQDHYRVALEELIRAKLENRPAAEAAEAAPPGNIVNLMDALKRSLEAA